MEVYLLQPWLPGIRYADLVDILVVAVLLYACLRWLRRRTSHAVAVATVLIGAVYFAARFFDMYLTLLLLQAGVIVIPVALVVIFQQDIRNSFERLSSWRPLPKGRTDRWASLVDPLLDAVAVLARQRTGALLVLRGHTPLDSHLRGGVPVGGRVSIPLLLSIFSTESPGHDGAVVIDGNRIERLGAHLPLSADVENVGREGTRHTAALGLAERSDALILVVSEERGTISVAHEGRIHPVASMSGLKDEVEEFLQEKYPARRQAHHFRFLIDNLLIKALSLGFAFLVWFQFAYRVETVQRTFDEVPIEYRNLPENWVVDELGPSKAKVTLTGSERAYRTLDKDKLKFSIDLSEVSKEGALPIDLPEQLQGMPSGLKVYLPEQETLTVKVLAYPVVTRELPITPRFGEGVPPDWKHNAEIKPSRVKVLVRKSYQDVIRDVETKEIHPAEIKPNEPFRVELNLPRYTRFFEKQGPLVRVTVRPPKKGDTKPEDESPGQKKEATPQSGPGS